MDRPDRRGPGHSQQHQLRDGPERANHLASHAPDGSVTGFVTGATSTFAGVANSFSYNQRLQPCRITASTGALPSNCGDANNAGNILDISCDFHVGNGNNGNVWAITNHKDASRNQTFGYDPLSRLISAQNAGTDCTEKTLNPNLTKYWGNSYTYDAWGNLLAKTVKKCNAESLSVTTDSNNHLQGGYAYDLSGNLTSDPTDGHSYAYDADSEIVQVDNGAGTYSYDADGNRARKVMGTSATEYIYFNDEIIAERNATTGAWTNYIFFNGERIARHDPTGSVAQYFSDHLKTTDIVTDALGNIQNQSDFYPWGGELQFVANDSNHYKFTGKERDTETGLDYFGARYYSSGMGRFVTPDWSATPEPVPYADLSDPQTLNQYSYVRGLPTTRADADGHCCDWGAIWDAGTGAVRGIVSSATFGAIGAPQPSDSGMSLFGQTAGTIIEGAAGVSWTAASPEMIGGGLLAEGPSAGTSTVVVAAGGLGLVAGPAMTLGAAKNQGAIINAMAKSSTSGENDAAAQGRQAHQGYDPGPGFKKEVTLPSGKKADAVKVTRKTGTVKELKPNNTRAIKRGQTQVEGYRKELQKQHPNKKWKTKVDTY